VETSPAPPPGYLEKAARVRGCHHPRAGLADAVELAVQELARHAGLEEIVDTRAAAAEIALAELDEPEPGDSRKELTGLLTQALAVHQVTRVVVRHRQVERTEREVGSGQHLRDVADPCPEGQEIAGQGADDVQRR